MNGKSDGAFDETPATLEKKACFTDAMQVA